MSDLHDRIVERIRAHGPMPFAAYMSLALYDPEHGYYASGQQRTGWGGHFITSPELDEGFGALWSQAFEQTWVAAGHPDRFEIVEVGPGEGTFAAAVLEAVEQPFASALVYRLVERVPEVSERQNRVLEGLGTIMHSESVADLPDIPAGCVFANEVVDNQPIHLVEATKEGLAEVMVAEQDGSLVFRLQPPSNAELEAFLERTGTIPEPGHRVEVTLAAESLITHVARRLSRGAIFLVDYGDEGPALARRGGSLVAYSEHGVSEEVLALPGRRDITAHANWTSVRQSLQRGGFEVRGPSTQRDVLLHLGARELDESLKQSHAGALSDGDGAAAVAALSRRQALAAVLDPGGLGGLDVMWGYKDIPSPDLALRDETGS